MRAFHHTAGRHDPDRHLGHHRHHRHHRHHQVEHRTGRAAPWFVIAALAFLAALISG
jgi:hypothetical protein